jgi:hypothetical protein
MFNRLFKKKTKQLSKVEFWEKYEFFELIADLHLAEKLLSEFKGGYCRKFDSAEDFHKALIEGIFDVEFDNVPDFTQIWNWFAPTCEWDSFAGIEGFELGNRIFMRTDYWKKNHDFVSGTKVSVNGEFGVIVKSELDKPNLFGTIRWDTAKENDTEDWNGMFGTFTKIGGKIIDQNHIFKYINDDGTKKTITD